MKDIKFLAFVAIITALWACNKEPQTAQQPVISNASVSDCHTSTDVLAAKDMNTDSVVVSWVGNGMMQVTHYNMMLDCGQANITTTVERVGNIITVVEHVGEQGITNCICLYDNSFRIDNLPQQQFTLIIKVESLICGHPEQSTVYVNVFNTHTNNV